MSGILEPGNGVLYMKVGTHAQEGLDEIIKRKRQEIEVTGRAFWGYGGNTCHPRTMVQPFARHYERRGGTIYLCMESMVSKHWALPDRADEFSVDGLNWESVPIGINALGSRYALVLKSLEEESFDLALSRTKVALGTSMGARGERYVRGRVDKACLEIVGNATEEPLSEDEFARPISLVAELAEPYAVFLRTTGEVSG